MASQIYTAIATEVEGGVTRPKCGSAAVKIKRNSDGTYTATANLQSDIDIINAIAGYVKQV